MIKKIEQCYIDNIIANAFEKIGNDLGDFLYKKESILISDCLYENTEIEIWNDFLAEELNEVLAESCKQLLTKMNLILK